MHIDQLLPGGGAARGGAAGAAELPCAAQREPKIAFGALSSAAKQVIVHAGSGAVLLYAIPFSR